VDRRAFIGTLTGALLAAPLAAEAQQAGKMPRIGILSPASTSATPVFEALRRGLRDLGYEEGRTIALEFRLAAGDSERLPALAAELVRLGVDVIVTDGAETPGVVAKVVQTIPIVMGTSGDPVAAKLVGSFAHPGGNITGFTLQSPGLAGKRVELFKDLLPQARRVGVLVQPGGSLTLGATEAAARGRGLEVRRFEVNGPSDLDGVFKRVGAAGINGMLCVPSAMLWNQRVRVVELAAPGYRRSIQNGSMPKPGGSCHMVPTCLPTSIAPRRTWTRSSKDPSRATFPYSSPPRSSCSSTSRPPRRSA
jgi:putative ABC transport system substrate-binding protein